MKQLPTIPGYRILKLLGQGGMADVYLGVQENLNREVAIKVLIPSLFRDQQFSIRFIKEAQTAAQLVHPNIITIHDVGKTGDFFYIVMEYLSQSLNQRIKETGIVSPDQALKIIKMIAAALDYAHNRGFIHRDIKPDNIMFRTDGTVVLVDFGIARAMDSSTQLTRTGMSIGTPHYMSPEQCRGEKIDGRSDIYSLGVQLFELLTGKVPYRAENTAGIIIKHIQEPVPTLPEQFKYLQPLLSKMMAKKKDERMARGKEVALFIDALLTAKSQEFLPTVPHIRQELEPIDQPTMLTPRPSTAFVAHKKEGGKKGLIAALVMIAVITVSVGLFFLLRNNNPVRNEFADPLSNVANNLKDDNNSSKTLPDPLVETQIEGQKELPVPDPDLQDTSKIDTSQGKDGVETLVEDIPIAVTRQDPGTIRKPGIKKTRLKKKPKSAIDLQLERDKKFNNYLKQARADLAKGDLDNALKHLAEAKKIKQTPGLTALDKSIRLAKEARQNYARALKENAPIKSVTMLGLDPQLRKQYNEWAKRIQWRVPGRFRWDVKGAVTLNLAIDQNGRISMKLENENLTVTPKRRKRMLMRAVKLKLITTKLPKPKDKENNPVKIEGWRVTFKVVKFKNLLNLIKQ